MTCRPTTQPPDVAWDWVRSLESLDADDVPAPVPLDELSVMIREDGELAETPALALLDEIQALRKALRGAAQSLTTLSTAGARNSDSGLDDMIDVRGYASSRAKVAWAALAARDADYDCGIADAVAVIETIGAADGGRLVGRMDEARGVAAGRCLLACWARDDAQSTETGRSER